MLIWGISLADSIMFSQVLVYFKLFVVRYHCICWTSKFVVLQKKGVLTHGKFNLKRKKFSPNWNKPHFFFPLFLSLCCILSQLSWARALWIILPVEVLGSPWISGSFCRGRRWDLVTWMQVPKSTRKSPEFLESQSLPDGSRCGTPAPVIVLSAWGHLSNGEGYAHLPILSTCPAPWAVWDDERGQELHSPMPRSRDTWGC